MPTSAAEQREDEVISLLVADLMRPGRTAAVLDSQGQQPYKIPTIPRSSAFS